MRDSANLDLLRSAAVALVVISHVRFYVGWAPSPAFDTNALGHVGVALFFVHTTLVLLRSLERHGPAFLPFLARRLLRIYPLSIAVVTLMAVLGVAAGAPPHAADVLSNLLLVQNLTGAKSTPDPLWTLPFEVQMYLALPALFLAIRSRAAARWLTGLYAASIAACLATGAWHQMNLVSFLPCFLPGAIAFHRQRGPATRSPLLLLAVVAAGAAAVPALVAAGASETPLLWGLCLALGFAIPRCREVAAPAVRAASHSIARYSYGVYLTHVFAFGLAFPASGPTLWQWAVFAALLPGFAFIAYHGIERHGIRAGAALAGHLARNRSGRAAPKVARTPGAV